MWRKSHLKVEIISVTFSFQVGDDEWGNRYRENLEKLNVGIEHVGIASGKTTGLAQINVAENGENQIVIVPGANDQLVPADVENVQDLLDASKVYYYE